MKRFLSLAPIVAIPPALVALVALGTFAGCGSDTSSGFGDDAGLFDGFPNDQGVIPGDEQPILFGDGGVGEGGDGGATEPASSLTLEQIWFITGVQTDFLIDFRTKTPVVTCGGSVGSADGFEGTAVFTEPKLGALLFYTDGRTVFNGKTNAALANGTLLFGDQSATEPALITPANSGAKDQFFIFTNNTNVANPSSVYYSLIDLAQGPNGTVTTKNQLLLNGNPGEALDVVPHTNGKDFWVLTYDGAASMKAFLVSGGVVSTTAVVSSTGLTGVVKRSSINHALDYDHLVMSLNYGGANGQIATAVIDRSTGKIGAAKPIVSGDLGYHASYSADGSKLYYVRGTEGWSGVAYQYDLTGNKETMLGGTGMAAAKLAPDGKVYWAAYSHAFMGVVAQPDQAGTACGFVEQGLDLKGCKVAFGVPNQTAAYLEYLPPIPK